MLGIFLLLGLGMAASFISIGDSDDDDVVEGAAQEHTMVQDQPNPSQGNVANVADLLTDVPDVVIAEEYRGETEAAFDELVAVGEFTEELADLALEVIDFRAGVISVDTAGGDDVVIGGSGDDLILTGEGSDVVMGGPGDDRVELGKNSDVYGFDTRSDEGDGSTGPVPLDTANFGDLVESDLEGGNDTILGGSGVDYIADGYGENRILGQQGEDFIVTVDQDALSPDRVMGGAGDDLIIVDQGDKVTGGNGSDFITVDVFEGVADGYQVVEITDFVLGEDILELEGNPAELRMSEPDGPGDVVANPVSVRDLDNGEDAVVSVDGVDVVLLVGGQGISLSDIRIST